MKPLKITIKCKYLILLEEKVQKVSENPNMDEWKNGEHEGKQHNNKHYFLQSPPKKTHLADLWVFHDSSDISKTQAHGFTRQLRKNVNIQVR